MKKLILNDGTEYNFTDDSHITHLTCVVDTFAVVDEMMENITAEKLAGATFDGNTIDNMVPSYCDAKSTYDDTIVSTFVIRAKTETELMKEEITELQEALAEIAGGME